VPFATSRRTSGGRAWAVTSLTATQYYLRPRCSFPSTSCWNWWARAFGCLSSRVAATTLARSKCGRGATEFVKLCAGLFAALLRVVMTTQYSTLKLSALHAGSAAASSVLPFPQSHFYRWSAPRSPLPPSAPVVASNGQSLRCRAGSLNESSFGSAAGLAYRTAQQNSTLR
jgi:hypothetical protein